MAYVFWGAFFFSDVGGSGAVALRALDRAIKVAIATVIAKTLIARSGVFCRGELD